MHSEWRYSLVFTSASSSRRCRSLDLVRMYLFVMSISTPQFFVCLFIVVVFCFCFVLVFWVFFSFGFPMSFFSVWAESDDNTQMIVSAVLFCFVLVCCCFYRKPLPSSFHTSFCCIVSIQVLRHILAFLACRQGKATRLR